MVCDANHCRARDALGTLVDFCLMPGQAHDLRETDTLIRHLSAGHLLAPSHGLQANHCRARDRAFDADWLRDNLLDRGIIPVIPPKSNRKFPAEFDKETCKWRHLIETYFGKQRHSDALMQNRQNRQNRQKL